jgi:hypothetical protein
MTEPPKKRLCGEMSWPVVRDCKTKAVMCGKHMYVAIPFELLMPLLFGRGILRHNLQI